MSYDGKPIGERGRNLLSEPWRPLLAGLGIALVAVFWLQLFGEAAAVVRLLLVLLALLAGGSAIVIRPSSPAVVGLGGFCALLCGMALSPSWDTLRTLAMVAALFAAVCALLLLMPRTVRRLAVSLLIVFHFGGILTAVTSVPPQPWLSSYVWTHVYRPYLEFMYLNNAYHFYSPNPGPATLLWFHVAYEDGTARWIKMPNREDYPLAVNYQRRLSMTESINQLVPPGPTIPPDVLNRRFNAYRLYEIPKHPELPDTFQYREPVSFSKRMLEAYARHVAKTARHLTDPDQKVTRVKVYRVIHQIPLPRDIATRNAFDDDTAYLPFFQGEFDPDGKLVNPQDPLLYWLIPIIRAPKEHVNITFLGTPEYRYNPNDFDLKDYLELHANLKSAR